jgi:hypothetical protein
VLWEVSRILHDDKEMMNTERAMRNERRVSGFNASFVIHHSSSFIIRFFVLCLFERRAFIVRGDAVVFVGPVAEVY